MTQKRQPIVLLTGGTGGHVIPTEVVGKALLKEGKLVHIITDTRGARFLEKNPSYGLTVLSLPTGNFIKRLLGVAKGAFSLYFQFKKLKPKFLIGFGGYPSAAGTIASIFIKCPLYLYEQNAVLGRVNRFFAPFAHKIFMSFPNTLKVPFYIRKKPILVGPIVRPIFLSEAKQQTQKENFTFVVFGGSQGANKLVKSAIEGVSLVPQAIQEKMHLILQVPESLLGWVEESSKELKLKKFEYAPFFWDMHDKIAKASFIMARSGASTVGEILAMHKPCLFVPYPYATNQHQVENAKRLVNLDLGWMVLDKDLTPMFLARKLESLIQYPSFLEEKEKSFYKKIIPFRPESSLKKLLEEIE